MPKKRRRSALTTPRRVRARTLDLDQDTLDLPNLPQAFLYDVNSFQYHCYIGELTTQCTHCLAFKFPNETSGLCCSNGRVDLQPFPEPPPELQLLLSGESALSNHFLEKIRLYNNCFQLTSMGYTDASLNGWNPQFRVQGQVYHRIGSLLPSTQNQHSFLQVYFMENDAASACRYSLFQGLQPGIISDLQDMLHRHNSYVIQLKCAYEFARSNFDSYVIVINEEARPTGEHERRFNAPSSSNDVAILMPNDPVGLRDIVLHTRNDECKRISELHKAYDPLQYPLLFPFGTDGWNLQLKLTSRHKITELQYYCFHFFTRQSNYILRAKKLFQQFLVDAYAKIECSRLKYIRFAQGRLRADKYGELRDAISNQDNADPTNLGQRIILPSSYTGGPRYMFERQQDAMCYVRQYGRPDLFITITTNPKWPEITDNLLENQQPHDRPDLLVRVFKQKLNKAMTLMKSGCFGTLQAWLYSIEFQKRGLPHAHILLWMKKDAKIQPDLIDRVVSAEIPNKEQDKELHSIVTTQMIHGPCGHINPTSPCMKDGKCSKKFPMPFQSQTEIGNDSYPKYRRRSPENYGNSTVKSVNQTDVQIDNRWVVPYNPWLLRQLKCHVNVEICSSIRSIKYVLKYVHNGVDQATFQLQHENQRDEISNFVSARYIGSTEAAWRIFEFPLTERHPAVVQLAVHLENGQRVYFNEDTVMNVATAPPPATTLTAFFHLCQSDNFAQTLLYMDVPVYFTWNSSSKSWIRRKRGEKVEVNGHEVFETPTIGRMYTVSPKQGECFFLRLLLTVVKGPTSFKSLRYFRGIAHGLLEQDNVHQITLQEASVSHHPQSLRSLFAVLLIHAQPTNPKELWNEFEFPLCEDFIHQSLSRDQAKNLALIHIEDMVLSMNGEALETFGLPKTERDAPARWGMGIEAQYDIQHEQETLQQNTQILTPEQKHVYKTITQSIDHNTGGIYFLDAPGGCGKTFLIKTLLASQRSQGRIAIATASSGLAATLLPGGRTVHSTFKVPLNVTNTDQPMCSIKKGTALARLIQKATVLIIDEAPMLHKKVIEALDRTFQDIRSSEAVMGGLLTLMCGDFRQILPVIPQGTRANIVNASLKKSHLWEHVRTFKLTQNMRVLANGTDSTFPDLLLNIGNGQLQPMTSDSDLISITEFGNEVRNIDGLIESVYHNFEENHRDAVWLTDRAILTPYNDTVTKINNRLMEKLSSDVMTYTSINRVVDDGQSVQFPIEFLNSIEISGLPPHCLQLKTGMPVMLMRSLKPPELINGTRCIVVSCNPNVAEVEIAAGAYKGQRHFIPRIPLEPSDSQIPFNFQRRQLPLRPCFAMTINKAQGQTLKCVGLDLRQPVFTHGMLYVALSRTGDGDNIHYLAPNGLTRNVVYTEVL